VSIVPWRISFHFRARQKIGSTSALPRFLIFFCTQRRPTSPPQNWGRCPPHCWWWRKKVWLVGEKALGRRNGDLGGQRRRRRRRGGGRGPRRATTPSSSWAGGGGGRSARDALVEYFEIYHGSCRAGSVTERGATLDFDGADFGDHGRR
jgi:hypothetical protein